LYGIKYFMSIKSFANSSIGTSGPLHVHVCELAYARATIGEGGEESIAQRLAQSFSDRNDIRLMTKIRHVTKLIWLFLPKTSEKHSKNGIL
jgi:hypothetical protein